MPADGCWIKQYLRTKEGRDARGLGIPLVPANEHADRAVSRLPHLEAARRLRSVGVGVAGSEIVFLLEHRVVRDVHLAIHPEQRAVRVDDGGRVAVDAGPLAFIHRDDEHDLQLRRERAQHLGRVAGNRLGEVEVLLLKRLAEVRRAEQFLQADDLRAAPGGLANLRDGRGERLRLVAGDGVLDQPDSDVRSGSHGGRNVHETDRADSIRYCERNGNCLTTDYTETGGYDNCNKKNLGERQQRSTLRLLFPQKARSGSAIQPAVFREIRGKGLQFVVGSNLYGFCAGFFIASATAAPSSVYESPTISLNGSITCEIFPLGSTTKRTRFA